MAGATPTPPLLYLHICQARSGRILVNAFFILNEINGVNVGEQYSLLEDSPGSQETNVTNVGSGMATKK